MKHDYLLHKRGSIWYVKLSHEKTYHSTGKAREPDAEREARRLLGERERPEKPPTRLRDFAAGFFDWDTSEWIRARHAGGHRFSRATAAFRQQQLAGYIFKKWGDWLLGQVDGVDVERWLLGQDLSNQTRNHIMFTFKIVMREAKRQRYVRVDPMVDCRPFAVGRGNYKETAAFSRDDLGLLFPAEDAALTATWGSLFYASLFLTMAATGARPGEIRALRWGRVRWDIPAILITEAISFSGEITQPKANEQRGIPLPARAAAVLRRWRDATPCSGPDDFAFYGETRAAPISMRAVSVRLASTMAALDLRGGQTVRSFRHTFNTMYRHVLTDAALREFTGHRSEQMSQRYDHSELVDRLRKFDSSRPLLEALWNT
jgi:integrase